MNTLANYKHIVRNAKSMEEVDLAIKIAIKNLAPVDSMELIRYSKDAPRFIEMNKFDSELLSELDWVA